MRISIVMILLVLLKNNFLFCGDENLDPIKGNTMLTNGGYLDRHELGINSQHRLKRQNNGLHESLFNYRNLVNVVDYDSELDSCSEVTDVIRKKSSDSTSMTNKKSLYGFFKLLKNALSFPKLGGRLSLMHIDEDNLTQENSLTTNEKSPDKSEMYTQFLDLNVRDNSLDTSLSVESLTRGSMIDENIIGENATNFSDKKIIRLLYVEDSKVIKEVVKHHINNLNNENDSDVKYDLVLKTWGWEAVDYYLNCGTELMPDIILTDLNMERFRASDGTYLDNKAGIEFARFLKGDSTSLYFNKK